MRGTGLLLCILSATAVLTVMPMAGAAHEPDAPAGLRAFVEVDGSAQFVELRWPNSADDDGSTSYLYNSSFHYGIWFENGDVEDEQDWQEASGYQSMRLEFGGAGLAINFTINVTHNGAAFASSCTVNVTTDQHGDYDACGSMATDFDEELYCFTRDTETTPGDPSTLGANYWAHMQILSDGTWRLEDNQASPRYRLVAINLPGTTGTYQWFFEIEATSGDVDRSEVKMFWSEEFGDVGSATRGNLQNTGAFTNGVGFELEEGNTNWLVDAYTVTNGVRSTLASGSLGGEPTGEMNPGNVTIDMNAGIMNVTIDGDTLQWPLMNRGPFQSFWIADDGSESPSPLSFDDADTDFDNTEGTNFDCLYGTSLPGQAQGGEAGTMSQAQPIEEFGDDGGYGGQPAFPGLNVTNAASSLGVSVQNMGYILFALLALLIIGAGFVLAGALGGLVALGLALAAGAVMNLIEYYWLVVAFLGCAAVIATRFKGGGA